MSEGVKISMSDESLDERTLEVSGIPADVEDEYLYLYFENRRRSGGGTLTSIRRNGSTAVLVFEDAEVALRILSKGPHVLQNATLAIQKQAKRDHRKLLLRGINPRTSLELVELYVENMTGMSSEDYTLYPSPGRDLVLIHFHMPLSEDFQTLFTKISNKPLDGFQIYPEQTEQTDSILVENLGPNISEDILWLYFESRRGGMASVKDVRMIADGTARVSFENVEAVERTLDNKSHKLNENHLKIQPYFDFLQKNKTLPFPCSLDREVEANGDGAEFPQVESSGQAQASPSVPQQMVVSAESLPLKEAVEDIAEMVKWDALPAANPSPNLISISDSLKLSLFESSQFLKDLQKSHQNFSINIVDNVVQIAGPNQQGIEQLKSLLLEFLGGFSQAHITFDPETAAFISTEEVKDRLLQILRQQGLESVYTVTDCVAVVTSLSLNMVTQTCDLIKSSICDFSIAVMPEHECMLYSKEWSEFLSSLQFCATKVSSRGDEIKVVTMKGWEDDKQMSIVEFLSTPVQGETVITMEPGMLKYIQNHCHQLLADMDQVSIFPLEEGDVSGLRLCGNSNACQMAEEVLRSIVASVYTRTITVNQPGIARFLVQEEGTSIINEMQTKFQVYIGMERVHWEPLEDQDIFELAGKLTLQQNFTRDSTDVYSGCTALPMQSDLTEANVNASDLSGADRGLIEEAKRLVSFIDVDVDLTTSPDKSISVPNLDDENLYMAPDDTALSLSGNEEDMPEAGVGQQEAEGLEPMEYPTQNQEAEKTSSGLEEDGMLCLALQYSMERNVWVDEEDELRQVLELSKRETRQDAAASADAHLERAIHVSLQDAIKEANQAVIFVFAGYSCDLIRVDIALGKKVSLRQCEEKIEHKCLKNLSEHQRNCVELIKRKHAVEIQIQGTTATLSGFKDYVSEAVPDLKKLLGRISNMASESEVLQTVQWVWHDTKSVPTSYPPKATVFIENAWKMRQKKLDIVFNNQPYIIDFEKMQEYNLASGKSVKIARKILSSVDLYTDIPDEDFSILSNLPEASPVDEDSDEFQEVVKDFYDSIKEHHNKIKIIKVEKVANRLLFNQYKLKKASMLHSATDPDVERTLYHGTSETSVKEICIHGFNRSFCGKNATVYGQGVYFAVNSAISVLDQYSPPNADGHKFVFVAKVLTGDFTKGRHEMKTAPLKENSEIPLRYHSVTDNTDSPTLFVIFNDTQAYPEYLITCQKIHV